MKLSPEELCTACFFSLGGLIFHSRVVRLCNTRIFVVRWQKNIYYFISCSVIYFIVTQNTLFASILPHFVLQSFVVHGQTIHLDILIIIHVIWTVLCILHGIDASKKFAWTQQKTWRKWSEHDTEQDYSEQEKRLWPLNIKSEELFLSHGCGLCMNRRYKPENHTCQIMLNCKLVQRF